MVAAVLAILAMVGFLMVFAALSFCAVPAANKDFLNMGFIALIGQVGTAFGYYLGSSLGSAHKNDLLAQSTVLPAPLPPEKPLSEGGFARLQLMTAMILIASLFTLAACATMKKNGPQVTAGKSLLAVKQTIVAAASSTDALCRSKQLAADKCRQAKAAYELAKPAYDSAVDAYLLMSEGGDPAAFGAALTHAQGLAASMQTLAGGAQ